MSHPGRVLYCHCAWARVLPPQTRDAALEALCASGLSFEATPDLCALALRRDPRLAELSHGENVTLLACHPRAVRWLFAAAGAPLDPARSNLIDLRSLGAAEVAATVGTLAADSKAADPAKAQALRALIERGQGGLVVNGCLAAEPAGGSIPPAQPAPGGGAWFPTIDFERCTHCMQCLSFCLFDVFGVNGAGRIEVRHGGNSKPNCAACSRVCPEVAIVFPKHKTPPINGEAVPAGAALREKVKVDISMLLGGDIYSALRARSGGLRARFSTERDPQTALEERRRCLAQMARLGDIPPEVLMSLPTPEEIQRRAQEAQARAQAAIEARDRSQAGGGTPEPA